MCFLLYILFCSYASGCPRREGNHQTHALEVFNHITHKVVKDAISYALIQVNNMYYKDIIGLKMNKKLGSSLIYLTEEQYWKVKISKSFYIQYLILVVT
jgi:hypothetical protein